jgi:glycosyltransferase involved in cell wall biosynthesis
MVRHGLRNDNYIIIPNVVDMKMFHPQDTPPSGPRKKFVHVSCFEDKQKNISGLLKVLKRISMQRKDWECHMIGEGIHYERLMEQAEELGLKGNEVIFHGLKENDELAALMRDAWFQVMFSRFENLPVVILESYASGVPVLSTDVGGIREHLNPDLGILIPSEDEKGLYNALNEMLDHPERYDKEKIRAYAMEHFSKEVIGRQLVEVYREVFSV